MAGHGEVVDWKYATRAIWGQAYCEDSFTTLMDQHVRLWALEAVEDIGHVQWPRAVGLSGEVLVFK